MLPWVDARRKTSRFQVRNGLIGVVSKNRGTPKWMVYIYRGKYIRIDDLGGTLFLETLI